MRAVRMRVFFLLSLLLNGSAFAASSFPDTLRVELLEDGRNIKLLGNFRYVDSANTEWFVPAGTIADGASIPQLAWTLIGGPLTGKYRGPSVIHDFYCETKTKSWSSVHKVFFEAMRTAGVDETKSKIMYAAVYYFGPRWETETRSVRQCANYEDDECTKWQDAIQTKTSTMSIEYSEVEANKLKDVILSENLNIEQIESLIDKKIKERAFGSFE